jgi:hypothetical protein
MAKAKIEELTPKFSTVESGPRRTLIVGNLASGKKFLGSKVSECLRAPPDSS